MRGKTVKKLRKFVTIVLENSQGNTENPKTLLRRMKREWQRRGVVGRDFVETVVSGNIE